jgi:hypothetical protein
MRRSLTAALLLAPVCLAPAGAQEAERRTAVFELELHDTSGEGAAPAHAKRIALVSAELRRLIDASPAYAVIDTAPVAARMAERLPLRGCNGCELDLGRDLGAELVVTATIQKISTLILSIQIVMRAVADGRVVAVGTADIRGDTDAAWLHGVRWLGRNRLGLGREKAG